MDSGAGKSCASKAKHFKHVKTCNVPSKARMATASGQELVSRGTFRVKGRTSEGQVVEPNFEDVDVDMPIVAVNDLSQENTEVIFRKGSSELLDIHTGRRSRFAKQRGVYFMKIYYKKRVKMPVNMMMSRVWVLPGRELLRVLLPCKTDSTYIG